LTAQKSPLTLGREIDSQKELAMFDNDEVIEIVDDASGDTYFYEVPIEVDELPGIVDLRLMLEVWDYE